MEIVPPGGDGATRYGYDQRNLLITSTLDSGAGYEPLADFAYDGMGNRLQQVDYSGSQTVTITYTNDIVGLSQVLVADDGTSQVYNLFGLDLISQDEGTATRYLLADGLGSVRTEIVGSAIEAVINYSPYGNALSQSGMSGSVYGFTGEQKDSATGLLYLRARHYSPLIQLFVSRDHWVGNPKHPSTLHGYVYGDNNPFNNVDPSGFCSQRGWNDSSGIFTEENCDRIEDGDLEFTEQWYYDFADHVENRLPRTAAHFRHFLSGTGGELHLPQSFIKDDILGISRLNGSINDLTNWYIRSHIDDLSVCTQTPVGPDIYARGFTPNYAQAHPIGAFFLGTNELDVAGSLGSFRIDVEFSGNLHRTRSWIGRTEAALNVHVVILDIYDWHAGLEVEYEGNEIPDAWAQSLADNGLAAPFLVRGDYTYSTDRDLSRPLFVISSPPSPWVEASCIGSQFEITQFEPGGLAGGGPRRTDYCGKPMR